jgi:outer membrane protein assembly factor BamA
VTRGRKVATGAGVVAGLAIAAAAALLGSGWVEERLRREVEARGSALLGGTLRVGRLRLGLLPVAVRLQDVSLAKRGNRGSEAGGDVPEIRVRAGLWMMLGLARGPVQVQVERPRARVVLAAGRPIASEEEPLVPGGLLARVPPGSRLEVRDAEVAFEMTGGPGGRLAGVRLTVEPLPGVTAVRGNLEFRDGEARAAGLEFGGMSGGGAFRVAGDGAHLDTLSLRGAGIAIGGRGDVRFGDAPEAQGSLEITADLESLARLAPEGAAPAGRIEARLSGSWTPAAATAAGQVECVGLRLWGVSLDSLRGDLEIGETIRLRGLRAHLFGGEASGSVDVERRGTRRHAALDLSVDGVDIGQLLAFAGWAGPPLSGTLHYRGRHEADTGGLASLRGSGVLDAVGHYVSPRGADLPLEITSTVLAEGETIVLKGGTIRAGSTRGSFSGTVRRGDGIRLRLSGATGDISEILPLFAQPPKKPPAPQPAPGTKPAPAPAAGPASGAAASRGGDRGVAPARWRPGAWGGRAPPALAAALPPWFTHPPAHLSPPPAPTAPAAAPATPPAAGPGAAPRAGAAVPGPSAPGAAPDTPLERLVRALGGRWEWSGDLHYGPGGMSFEGTVRGSGLGLHGTPLGALEARIRYRDERLEIDGGVLRLDQGGDIAIGGRIDFRPPGSMAVEATADHFPLGPFLEVAAIPLPIDGLFSGRVLLGGRPDSPSGRATVRAEPVSVAGVAFDAIEGEVLFTPDLLETERFILAQGPGLLTLSGSLPYRDAGAWLPPEEGEPGVLVAGDGIDLSLWSGLARGVPLEGHATLKGRIGGSLAQPRGALALRAEGVRVNGSEVGPVEADVVLAGGGATVRAAAPGRHVRVEGNVVFGDPGAVELRAVLQDSVLTGREVFREAPQDTRLVLTGEVALRGPLGGLRDLEARADLAAVGVEAGGTVIRAADPVVVRLASGLIEMPPVRLLGPGTEIVVSAAIAPEESGPVRAEARGTFDLRLLRVLAGDLQASGRGEVVLSVGGTRLAPTWQGTLTAEADAVRHPDLPAPISDFQGRAALEGTTLTIERLEFLAGGGPVRGAGTILVGAAAPEDDAGGLRRRVFGLRRVDVRLQGKDVRAEFPEGFRSVADLDLTLTGDRAGVTLGGWVEIVRGIYRKDFRLEETITRRRPAELFDVEVPPGPLQRLRLDLTIRAPSDAWIRNDLGSIEGQGEVRVTGTLGRPSVAGRVTLIEGGTIQFRQVRYRVQSGTIDFADPQEIRPHFDLLAETRVASYQVTLHLEGTPDEFRYELGSDPPLPQPDIVALLLTGRTLGSLETGGAILAEETISSYLAGRLSTELMERLSGRGGLDVLVIDPLQVNAHGDPTARVTLGKRVTPDLFVTYSSELGSSQGSVYQLDYTLTRDFSFSSQRDADGSIGGDFKFIRRGEPPLPPGLDGARPPTVEAIRLEGELRYPDRRLRRKLRVRRGRPRDRAEINAGIDRLEQFYRDRGYLTAEVDHEERAAGPDGVELVVTVRSGPRLTLRFEGDRVRDNLRRQVAEAWQRELFLDDVLDTASGTILDALRDRGHLRAAVEPVVETRDPDHVRVLFRVRRGPRIRASSVRVPGASQIPERRVLGVIRTAPDGLFTRGIVRRDVLAEDAEAIRDLYLERGFPAAKVDEPRVDFDAAGRRAAVLFPVEEGPRVTIRGVVFEGNEAFESDRLASLAALRPGHPYTARSVEEAIVRLRRAYDEAGFPDAEIDHRPPALTRGDEAPRAEDVVFRVRERRRQQVGRIEIGGNLLTRDGVIRKALTVRPGGWLSRNDMLRSQTRLYRRGIFRSVSVDAAPDGPPSGGPAGGAPPGDASAGQAPGGGSPPGPAPGNPAAGEPSPDPVPRTVRVEVREAAPLTQVFGIGYDSEAKLRGLYEITHRNVLGSGRAVGLLTRASELEQRAAVSYREMGIFGGRFDVLASAFVEDEERPAFEVRTIGSSVQLSRQLSRNTRTLYRYSLRDVDLSDAAATFEGTTLRLSSFAVSAVHDTRDAFFDPRRGHYLSGEVQWYGEGIASEADFTKTYTQFLFFREIAPRAVWAQALRVGLASPFGRSRDDPVSTGDALSGVPPSERFFAGGDTTVRGFRRDRLGPLDPLTGDPVGGEMVVLFNQEVRFPIWRFLHGVVFYDAGNVFRTRDDFDLDDLRHVAGAGLRFATPVGPFRLEYGHLLDREPGEDRGRLFLSIGQAF